jgi:putative peptidoglycan lipid II flippase
MHDTKTPVLVSVTTVALNLGLATFLALGLGMSQDGLALSLAITTTLEMVLLWTLLERKLPGWGLRSEGISVSLAKSGAAALVMGIILALLLPILGNILPASGKLEAAILTVVGVILGGAIYLAAARALRSQEVEQATGLVLRRFRKRG